jgi:hypothetical protein
MHYGPGLFLALRRWMQDERGQVRAVTSQGGSAQLAPGSAQDAARRLACAPLFAKELVDGLPG